MSFTDIFVKRPVLAICVNLVILIAGLQSLYSLNVRQYPRSDLAVVNIKTAYVGANADLVRGFITTPLERVIASADGVDYLESSSEQGFSNIIAHLRLNFDTNTALTQVQAKVAQVRNDLPPEAEAPVIEIEQSDNRFASMYLSFYSDVLEQNQITDYLIRVVQPQLSSIAGVQKAEILGARKFAMRIWLKAERLAALNISPTEVQTALRSNNFLSTIGRTKGDLINVNLLANTDLRSKEEFEKLVVKTTDNGVVRLADIADVMLGAENYDEDVRFGGQKATFMGIWVLPNANSIDVIKRVRAVIPEIEKRLPQGLSIGIPYDSTAYIKNAISEVIKTLSETILIVILVIFLFLGSFRSVIIPIVAIPLSLIGVCALMLVCGFSMNLLTLLAIVLSVGLVVDDAIVMLENVERYVETGLSPEQAAIKAARELFTPIIAMTITLATVYAPIGIQGGLTGALFREFAFTLAGSVIVSGFVALTLSPMMSAKLVKSSDQHGKFKIRINAILETIRIVYENLLKKSFNYKPVTLTASIVLALCLIPFYAMSMKELAPREDQGVIFSILQAPPNASLDFTMRYAAEVTKVFASFPEHNRTFQLVQPTFGFSGMLTKPWSERTRNTEELSQEAWGKLSMIPGVQTIVTTPAPLPGGSDFPVELVITTSAEPRELEGFANQLVGRAFASGKFMFAITDLKFDLPQSEIVIDRDKLAMLGLNLEQVGRDISVMTGGDFTNRFNIQGRSYKVIPQIKRSGRLTPEQLQEIYVSGPENKLVPLATFATIKNSVDARKLNRFQQLNSAKIQGVVIPGTSLDAGLSVLEEAAKEILPTSYTVDYAGESRQLRKEQGGLLVILVLALVLIYLVLGSQFESFKDPLIILAGSVPLALCGALFFVSFSKR